MRESLLVEIGVEIRDNARVNRNDLTFKVARFIMADWQSIAPAVVVKSPFSSILAVSKNKVEQCSNLTYDENDIITLARRWWPPAADLNTKLDSLTPTDEALESNWNAVETSITKMRGILSKRVREQARRPLGAQGDPDI